MAKHDDDKTEQAETAWTWLATPDPNREQTPSIDTPNEEVTTAAIHRLSERVIKLEAQSVALLNALVRYRAHHDQCLPAGLRPCRCQICAQADEAAIKAAKGGA